MIDRLQLHNIGVFPSLDLPLDPLTLLVGSNGAGKSTVLKALELVTRWHTGGFEPTEVREATRLEYRMFDTGPYRALDERWAMFALASFETLQAPRLGERSWRVVAEAGGAEHSVGREGEGFPSVIAADEPIARRVDPKDGWNNLLKAWEWRYEVPGLAPDAPYWSQHFRYTPPTSPAIARAVRLRLEQSALAAPSLPQGERSPMAPNGAGLASALAWQLGAEREVIEQIESDLARIVPQARRIRVLQAKVKRLIRKPFPVGDQVMTVPTEEDGVGHRLELELRGSGRVPAELLSEGTLYALGLLTALHGPDRPELLLIDDLDRGLHLTGQVRLMRVIEELQQQKPNLQIIATTHSPFQLEGIPAAQVRVFGLRAADGTANARRLSEHPDFARWAAAMRTEELWANLGEDWVVEG